MKILKPSHEILTPLPLDSILRLIEQAGRTSYKSEHAITAGSAPRFVKRLLESGHHSVIEHFSVTVRFTCDRGVSHELVRHRLASYTQESTRFVNYSEGRFGGELSVIKPLFWTEGSSEYSLWVLAMEKVEESYLALLRLGASPEEARTVLPSSLKTEIVMTCNLREWRHVLDLRCSPKAHPQMREIMIPLLTEFHENLPDLFQDIYEKYCKKN